MSTLRVNDDILYHILTFVPDFTYLYSCFLAAPEFYEIWLLYPKSISRIVAANLVGPVDAALDVIRCPYPAHKTEYSNHRQLLFPTQAFLVVPTIVPRHDPQTFDSDDLQGLGSMGWLADNLEEDFCLRWKDRRGAARLAPLESFRFRRALYRLMLFHKAYDYFGAIDDFWVHLEPLPSSQVQHMFQVRINFLDQLSTEELHQMQALATYMTQILPLDDEEVASPEEQLSYGPMALYMRLASGYIYHNSHSLFQSDIIKHYFFAPLEVVLHKRGAKLLPVDNQIWGQILDEPLERHDPCTHCGRVKPLWNQSNWNLLPSILPCRNEFANRLIPYHLRNNITHQLDVRLFVRDIERDPSSFFFQVFSLTSLDGDFADCTVDQWSCEDCLMEIVWDVLPQLWRARFLAQGQTLPTEDCPYGWNCWTQLDSWVHTSELNHICWPTKGEQIPLL